MKINIQTEDFYMTAELNNTATAEDLYRRLPLTLTMHPLQNREFYANISLSENAAESDGYKIGDIGYWTPGNALVFYYGPGYTGNLIILGRITSGLKELSSARKSFTAVIRKEE